MLTSNVASTTWNTSRTTRERCTTFQPPLSTRRNNRNKQHCTNGPSQDPAKVSPTTTVSATEFELTYLYAVYGGICNYHLEQYEEALAHYDIALTKPDKDEGQIKLGEIYYNRGLSNACLMKFEEAIQDYRDA